MPLTNPIIQIHKILRSIIWPYNQNSQNPQKNNKPKQTVYSINYPYNQDSNPSPKKKNPNKKMQKKNPKSSTKTETLTHTHSS